MESTAHPLPRYQDRYKEIYLKNGILIAVNGRRARSFYRRPAAQRGSTEDIRAARPFICLAFWGRSVEPRKNDREAKKRSGADSKENLIVIMRLTYGSLRSEPSPLRIMP